MNARLTQLSLALVAATVAVHLAGCVRSSNGDGSVGDHSDANTTRPSDSSETAPASDSRRRYPLGRLPTATIIVDGHEFEVWLAQDFDTARPGVVQEGLMYATPEELPDGRGMLFVFSDESPRGFWMLNTITPLDIAFARADGTIVKTWAMPPRTLQNFPSVEPAMFALEVRQGTFDRLGIAAGDTIELSPEVFETHP